MYLAARKPARVAFLLVVMLLPGLAAGSADDGRPNVLLIALDDLGYSDLGVYGGEIRTPNIDGLASRGVMFTDFHTTMTCSPTRAMLLTGVDHHLAGLGNMSGHMSANQVGRPGYEGRLNHRVVTIARLLGDAGYRTFFAGKWHLGRSEGSRPHERGFQRSFALLDAGASYFNDMRGLIERMPRVTYLADGQPVAALPEDFHASVYYADRMIEYIGESLDTHAPFFGYLALTAPHWPYHLPEAWIDRYRGRYDAGYDVVREQRFARLQSLGLVDEHYDLPARLPGVTAWSALTDEEQRRQARAMELYAALVEHADAQIGRVLSFLADAGALDDTFVFLLSDNGPEGNDRSRIATNATWLPQAWDLSYENMGRRNSYVYYGPGWAQVSSTPLLLFKAYPAEGGIRVPLIVAPPTFEDGGRRSSELATVRDIVPTILDVAGLQQPRAGGNTLTSHGVSLLPHLRSGAVSVHPAGELFGWELFGHRALRRDRWKLVWIDSGHGSGRWRLYDLSVDPGETTDLSTRHPDIVKRLIAAWDAYVSENHVVLPTGDQSSAFGYGSTGQE